MAAEPAPPFGPSDPSDHPALLGPGHRPPAGGTAALIASAVLYPLLASGLLLVGGSFLLFALTSGAAALAAGFALALCVLVPGTHWLLLLVLRWTRVPRPGAVALLLAGAVVLAFAQAALLVLVFGTGSFGGVPLTAAFEGVVAATVLAVSRGRALGWAWAAVGAVAAVSALVSAAG